MSARTVAMRRYAVVLVLLAAACGVSAHEDETSSTSSDALTELVAFEAESMTVVNGNVQSFSDAAASGGRAHRFWTAGTTSKTVTTTTTAAAIVVRARGEQCNGSPQMVVKIDGNQVMSSTVTATSTWTDYSANVAVPAGTHTIEISFTNDAYVSGSCDRNLLVDRVALAASSTTTPDSGTSDTGAVDSGQATVSQVIEAETLTPTSGNVAVFSDTTASAGKGLVYWTNGAASGSLTTSGTTTSLVVRARGDQCTAPVQMTVAVDGANVLTANVAQTAWTDFTAPVSIPSGSHTIAVTFTGDSYVAGSCDGNLRVDKISLGGGGATTTPDAGSTDSGTTTGSVVIAAVGDINPSGVAGATTNPGLTAQNIRNMAPTYFLGLGDFQYTQGTLSAILGGYDKNFGDLKAKTLPTAGPTHDVASASDQLGYKDYWGRDAFKAYSVDVGNWHIVSLPSAVHRYGVDTAGVLSWLENDLTANTKPCTLAFFHEPYWSRSTSTHSTSSNGILTPAVKPWIDALYNHGAELILNGHQHNYQRFAKMRPDGTPAANGVREILSGAGGIGFYAFNGTAPNVEASNDNTYGVLKVTLKSNGYDWQFVPNTAGGFTDSGSDVCH